MTQVLIVDDEKNILTTLSIGLRRHAFDVKQAQSGPEALRIMEEQPCDIVISDVRMRPMDGYALASRLREKFPWVSIVLMSAYGFGDEFYEGDEGLMYPRLTKPFTVAELVTVIREEQEKIEQHNQ
jgi:DNA-binding NtrC family response regulator